MVGLNASFVLGIVALNGTASPGFTFDARTVRKPEATLGPRLARWALRRDLPGHQAVRFPIGSMGRGCGSC